MTLFILILVVTAICSILYVLINEHNNLMRKVKKMKKDMDEEIEDLWSIFYELNDKFEDLHAKLEKDHYIHMSDMNHVTKRIMTLERSRELNNSFNDQESKGEEQK